MITPVTGSASIRCPLMNRTCKHGRACVDDSTERIPHLVNCALQAQLGTGHRHRWQEPPIGPTVDDLATALTELAPFEVTSPPSEVTFAGYAGKHLAWTVPDLPVEANGDETRFTGCHNGQLKSWVAFIDADLPGDAFYGYTGPGYVEDFWILDVDGTRLMIAAEQSAGSPAADVAERDAIVESIRFGP